MDRHLSLSPSDYHKWIIATDSSKLAVAVNTGALPVLLALV